MKYLNLVFAGILILGMISCGGKTQKTTHIEASESIEIEDEDSIEEEDETDYLESAMDALEDGNKDLASEKIKKAAEHIKGYLGEMDDPTNANDAIKALIDLSVKVKSGALTSAKELEVALLSLEMFSEDDLEFDDDDIED